MIPLGFVMLSMLSALALLPQLDHKLPKAEGLSYSPVQPLPMLGCMVVGWNSRNFRAPELVLSASFKVEEIRV